MNHDERLTSENALVDPSDTPHAGLHVPLAFGPFDDYVKNCPSYKSVLHLSKAPRCTILAEIITK